MTEKSLSHRQIFSKLFSVIEKTFPSLLFLFLIATGSGVFTPPASAAERILQLSPGNKIYQLAPYLDILEDKGKQLTIQDVSSPEFSGRFKPVNSRVLNLGITSSAWWARFTLQENSYGHLPGDRNDTWLLESPRPFIASMKLYLPEIDREGRETGGWRVDQGGFSDSSGDGRTYRKLLVFRLPGGYESPATLYLRVEDVTSIFLPLNVCTDTAYLDTSKVRMLGFGIYFGIILALAFYNLFLFISLRDKSYLWYSLYVIFFALYFLGTTGISYEYITSFSPPKDVRVALFFLGLGIIVAGQFSRSFLMTARFAKQGDRLITAYMTAAAVLCLFTPAIGIQTLHTSFTILGVVVPIITIGVGVHRWASGFRPARFFLLAWIFLCLGGLALALTLQGVLPYTLITFYGFQIGAGFEIILLSFALADRIKTMKHESEEARHSERRYHQLAITDSLTGLYNYRYFRNQVGLEIMRADSLIMPLSLVILDVDNFKKYNDRYGHPDGDIVLNSLGKVISASIRDSDLACRYGGDEFALILPGTHVQKATEVAERIRTSVEKLAFTLSPGVKEHLTVSIGVAEHLQGQDPAMLIILADKALYKAKHQGKNQIVPDKGETRMKDER